MSKPHHILIVDDDPVFRAVAEGVLLSVGDHHISTAGNGAEGMACLAAADPPVDIVILDLNMPTLDGLGYLRALSEAGFKGHVLISSGEAEAIVRSARNMGSLLGISIPGCLKKPIKQDALLALLEVCRQSDNAAPRAFGGLIADTRDAILVPFYQPQFDILTGEIVGLEALIRLETRDGRLFGPSTLFDQIQNATQWKTVSVDIAAKVMDDIERWQRQGSVRRVSINMDAKVVEDPDVLPTLLGLARDRDIDPSTIVFELTETAIPSSMSRLIEVLTRLRMSGFGVAIDDYGTGTSNYGLLRLCPFSELKVDRSIIQSATHDRIAYRFLENAVAMASELAMDVVAEGVETVEQLETARAAGVRIVQGFIFSRPVPYEAAFALANLRLDDPLLKADPFFRKSSVAVG